MYAFSSKSGSEPFRALGDLTWNDPTRKLLGRGEFIPKFLVSTQRILLGGVGGAMLIFLCVTKATSYWEC